MRSLLHVICFFYAFIELQSILYDTNPFQFDCLHHFSNGSYVSGIIKYCIRPVDDQNSKMVNFSDVNHPNLTFSELYRLNVTSHEVLLWSSSIDLAERYQYYIDQPTKYNRFNEQFFNCTSPWFGSHCQYSFELVSHVTETPVNAQSKSHMANAITHQTCYILLECDRGLASMCLDWREVCDGRIDCLNGGVDESQCIELELNECNENEYQCHNGLCIPKKFWNDEFDEAECLDKSDLLIMPDCPNIYLQLYIFACAEYACRPDEGRFPCGDGQCVEDFGECHNGRHLLLTESLSVQGNLPYDCWITMVCLSKITDQVNGVSCEQFVNLSQILPGLETCEYPIQFPTIPVLLGHVRFLYHPKQIFNINLELALVPDYVCYDEKLCDYLTSTFHHGDLTCRYGYEMNLGSDVKVSDWKSIIDLVKPHFHGCITQHYHDLDTHASSLYACKNSSKYISKSRLLDGISDCFLNDDEQVFEWSCSLNHPYRFQCLNDNHCQSILLLRNICHQSERQNNFDQILFYEICDRATDLSPMIIDGKNHSDETDCELWQCDNVYTRCNGFWSCPYGDDEENCTRPICPKRFLPCISLHNSTLICLPANQVGNGIVDCFGASDELEYCRQSSENEQTYRFYCQSDKTCVDHKTLCDGNEDCLLGDDETFCKDRPGLCDESNFDNLTDLEYVLCQIGSVGTHSFSLKTASISPPLPTIRNSSVHIHFLEQHITFSLENFARSEICNFGLHVYHRLGSGNISNICFCPPIYYGDRCQYQNQRVSLTITLGFVQHQKIYAIIATLIEDDEDQQEIHSYHQLTQVPKFRCEQPFNIYLLYSVRPKNTSKKYRIHIDVFDKTSLIYLASWYLKIPFAFLPVNRLAIFLTLPAYRTLHSGMCPFQCYKGTCMKYSNEERFFCRCFSGWSGAQCHTQIDCSNCSSDSMCVGLIQNRPICVCPVGKFGTRCLLKQSCPINFCENNGQCVVIDDRPVEDSYICICPETFFGSRCQQIKSKIEVSFHNMDVPSYLFAYIYSEINSGQPEPMFVMLQKVKMFQNIVKFYPMYLFYIVILKIDVSYYLAAIQQTDRADISTIISPAQRCVPFYELFSSELLTLPRIHRIKHYHVPCQNDINLQCFIDESYICLCTREHHSNCFLFNFNMTFMCEDDVYCENDGICLQDRPKCPESILCVCADCFFGDRCQFYAKGIGLTLEDMFRYVIRPNLTFKDQSIIVKLSAAITMIIFVAGLWNSLLAYLAFHQQKSREVGSGMYLHLSSIVSSLVVIMLTTKFWFVIFTHAHQSINRLVLHGGCVLLEIALKLFLNMSNWLNACVAIERVIAVFQGIHFNKRQSQCIARWILRFLPFVILGSLSHEFIYRGLFDDYEEQRVWCVFRYSKSAEKYSTVIQLFHFIAPFLINLLSAIFIIYSMARQRAMFQTRQSYKHQLLKQFNEHKQLIVSPIVFVILSVPRLLISLFSGCIKVSRNPWLYLSGYFISFIPSAFIFAIFVLPSTFYKKQFRESIVRWQRRFFRS